jgi:hypothetical protein
MATWIAHLRIAEELLKDYNVEVLPFLLGNIGPDSGVPDKEWSTFDPPKKVTHWINESGEIDYQGFYEKYISNNSQRDNKERNDYLLGYYVHLISDASWGKIVDQLQANPLYHKKLKEDKNFIWTVKKDWYGQDFNYLEENKNSIFYHTFIKIKTVADYIDYFPDKALEKQLHYIQKFYLTSKAELNRTFEYLSKEAMDEYVKDTVDLIKKILEKKDISVSKKVKINNHIDLKKMV